MGEKQPKTRLTLDQLRAFAADMHSQAAAVEAFVQRAVEMGLNSLEVKNHASGLQGIDKLTTFTGSIYKAISQTSLSAAIEESSPEELIAKEIAAELDNKKPKKAAEKKSTYRKDS